MFSVSLSNISFRDFLNVQIPSLQRHLHAATHTKMQMSMCRMHIAEVANIVSWFNKSVDLAECLF